MKNVDLYCYSSNQAARWYLSGRTIGCDDMLPRKDYYSRPLAHVAEKFLFLTHHKLEREYCFASDIKSSELSICPVVLTVDLSSGHFPGWLVSVEEDCKPAFRKDVAKAYNPKKHRGVFIQTALPFSAVKSFGFYSDDDKKMLGSINPDLWYPVDLYETLDEEAFKDGLGIDFKDLGAIAGTLDVSEAAFRKEKLRMKLQAAVWANFHASASSSPNGYSFNFDHEAARMLDISQDDLDKEVHGYSVISKEFDRDERPTFFEMLVGVLEARELEKETVKGSSRKTAFSGNKKSREAAKQLSMTDGYDSQVASVQHDATERDVLYSIVDYLEERLGNDVEKVDDWEGLFDGLIHECPDLAHDLDVFKYDFLANVRNEISARTPKELVAESKALGPCRVLSSLLFIARNLDDFFQFENDLKTYCNDKESNKCAYILWAYFYGVDNVPGEGYNKDNRPLWSFAEQFASSRITDKYLFELLPPEKVSVVEGKVFNRQLRIERGAVTPSAIRNYFLRKIEDNDIEAISLLSKGLLADEVIEWMIEKDSFIFRLFRAYFRKTYESIVGKAPQERDCVERIRSLIETMTPDELVSDDLSDFMKSYFENQDRFVERSSFRDNKPAWKEEYFDSIGF